MDGYSVCLCCSKSRGAIKWRTHNIIILRKVDLLIPQVLGWMAGSKEVTLCCLSRNLWHIVQVLFSYFCFIFLHNIGYGLIKWVEVTAVITDITYNNSRQKEIPRGKESPFNSCIKIGP